MWFRRFRPVFLRMTLPVAELLLITLRAVEVLLLLPLLPTGVCPDLCLLEGTLTLLALLLRQGLIQSSLWLLLTGTTLLHLGYSFKPNHVLG